MGERRKSSFKYQVEINKEEIIKAIPAEEKKTNNNVLCSPLTKWICLSTSPVPRSRNGYLWKIWFYKYHLIGQWFYDGQPQYLLFTNQNYLFAFDFFTNFDLSLIWGNPLGLPKAIYLEKTVLVQKKS